MNKELINWDGRIPTIFLDYSDFTGKSVSHTIVIDGVDVTEKIVGLKEVRNSGHTLNFTEPTDLAEICNGGEEIHIKIVDSEHGEVENFYSYPYEASSENILKKGVEFIKLYKLNGKLFPILSEYNPNKIHAKLFKIVNKKPFSEKREMVDRKGLEVFVTDEWNLKNPIIKSFKLDF